MDGATGDVSLLFLLHYYHHMEHLVSAINNYNSLIPLRLSQKLVLFFSTHISQTPSPTFLLSAYSWLCSFHVSSPLGHESGLLDPPSHM
jgi:hypothetical protein